MRRRWLPVLVMGLAGCAGPDIEDFANTSPAFVPEDYFQGTTRVWGLFEDRFGNVRQQFVADVEGSFDGEVLTLDESFTFADGTTDSRVWRLAKTAEGRYEGGANDTVGTAIGEVIGQAFHLEYDLELDVGDDSWQMHFDDWLLLQPDGTVINRAIVTKFGVRIGEMSAFFQKIDPGFQKIDPGRQP